ncbi:MAG: hypothetical protein JSS82_09880 [Bacteroidetes bacterium]|nr:hypothetical protein [Bacteroidota bacterium]
MWEGFMQQEQPNDYLLSVVDLCRLAYGKVTIRLLWDIGLSPPAQDSAFTKALNAAKQNVSDEINAYQKTLPKAEQKIWEQSGNFDNMICAAIPNAKRLMDVNEYFAVDYPAIRVAEREKIEDAFSVRLLDLLKNPLALAMLSRLTNIPQGSDERMEIELVAEGFHAYISDEDAGKQGIDNILWQNIVGTA